MGREKPVLFPRHQRLLVELGERIKLARKRRRLTTAQVAERAGISRSTLYLLESGEANSSLGTMLQVLVALRLELDLECIAKDDVLGQKLMDAQLLGTRKRKNSPSVNPSKGEA